MISVTAISKTQIDLTWADNSNNENLFKIERSANNRSFSEIATAAEGQTSFSNTGLARNITYYYRRRATNAAGNSSYSNTKSARTLR